MDINLWKTQKVTTINIFTFITVSALCKCDFQVMQSFCNIKVLWASQSVGDWLRELSSWKEIDMLHVLGEDDHLPSPAVQLY